MIHIVDVSDLRDVTRLRILRPSMRVEIPQPKLAEKPQIVAANKMDITEDAQYEGSKLISKTRAIKSFRFQHSFIEAYPVDRHAFRVGHAA